MISQMLMIFTLLTIWISLAWGLVILFSAVHFWFKHSDFRVDTSPLPYYPKVTIVVPAHNEDVVIAQTAKAILDMNYPHDRVELLLFADNCSDNTYAECLSVQAMPEYAGRNLTIIDRTGTGGKAGVLNDALEMATGEYICVYDADAMPEKNALYFLVKEVLKDPLFEGIEWIIVSLGGDGAFAKHGDSFYKVDIPKIEVVNPVGSGDSTVAGISAALSSGKDDVALLTHAMVLGMLNAQEKITGHVNMAHYDDLYQNIIVKEV